MKYGDDAISPTEQESASGKQTHERPIWRAKHAANSNHSTLLRLNSRQMSGSISDVLKQW
jgi:hypothetical protein